MDNQGKLANANVLTSYFTKSHFSLVAFHNLVNEKIGPGVCGVFGFWSGA